MVCPRNNRLADYIVKKGSIGAGLFRMIRWPGLLDCCFKSRRTNHTGISEIAEEGQYGEDIIQHLEMCKRIDKIITNAIRLEKRKPELAMAVYERAVSEIYKYDQQGDPARAWRNVRYPINRLTHLLERHNRFQKCLGKIEWYETCDDRLGISKHDAEQIAKRKIRVLKMLSSQPL